MLDLVLLASTIGLATAAGLYSHRLWPAGSERTSDRLVSIVLWVVLPPCFFVNIANFDIASSAGLGLLVGCGCLLVGGLAAWLLSSQVLALPDRETGALICATIVANTGYFGLPATLIVFGSTAVSRAAAWDALLTGPMTFLGGFAVGAFYGGVAEMGAAQRILSFVRRNPVLWVLPFALVTPSSLIPSWALTVSHDAFLALLPVGFYILGVNLAFRGAEPRHGSLTIPIVTATGLRLVLIPVMFVAACALIGNIPTSFDIQASAPTGINALIIASLFGLDRRLTAGVIALTTGVALGIVIVIGLVR